jgi:hypothetical protein
MKERSRPTVVKTEPMDTDQALRSSYTTMVAKGKQSQGFPIVISSEESDPSTPMGTTAKRNNVPKTK